MKWKTILIIVLSLVVVETVSAKNKKKKIIISGYVTDGNDKPLEDVSIIVDGETLNKQTNAKGFYKIKVKPNIKTIMVFSLLHGGLEIENTGRRKINFILAPSTVDGKFITKDKLIETGYGIEKKVIYHIV